MNQGDIVPEYSTEELLRMSLQQLANSDNTTPHMELYSSTTAHTLTTSNYDKFGGDSFLSTGYIEWYWVALGLIVPVLLGTLFCILDHLRRKKNIKSGRHSERRLESMCERNKYVPPKYEEIIPNNQIVIEPVPQLPVNSYPTPPIFTIETEVLSSSSTSPQEVTKSAQVTPSTNFQPSSTPAFSDSLSINSSTNLSIGECSLPSASTSHSHDEADNHSLVKSEIRDTELTTEAPPSYDEYHKYEIFGSRAELV